MTNTTTNTRDVKAHFDNVAELLATLKVSRFPGNDHIHADAEGERGWMCSDRPDVTNYKHAIAAMAEPKFDAGVKRIETLARKIDVPAPRSIRRRLTRGDHGDELDMSRVWNGDLENAWTRATRQASQGASRVLVQVFVGAPSSTKSEQVAWRGVAALALADALEQAGYTVNVEAMRRANLACSGNTARHDISVTVKADGEPLDLHRAASLIASTLLFRGVMLEHAARNAPMQINSTISQTTYDRAKADTGRHGYDFACLATDGVKDAASATAWVKAQIAALDATHDGAGH